MPLKLWIRHLDREHRRKALADVFTSQIAIGIFALAALLGKGVEGASQNSFKALDMGPTINCADVVCKAKNAVGISIHAPLQGSLNLHSLLFRIHINDVRMQRIFLRIHVGDVLFDATLIEINLLVGLACGIAG